MRDMSVSLRKALKYGILLLVFSSIIFLCFYDPITKNISERIVFKYDYNMQHILFYEEFFRLIEQKDLSWTWNLLFGNSFYSSKAYYLIGDVFAWMSYLIFKLNGNVVKSMSYVLYIKLLVSAIGMYLYTGRIIKDNHSHTYIYRLIFSLLFTFSGWNTIFIEHPVFTSFYTVIPFVLLGVEIYFQNRKYSIFILSSTWLLMTNYYLSWPFCIFLLLYWVFRNILGTEDFKLKYFFTSSFELLGYFLIGVGLSAVVWLPSLVYMINSSRLGAETAIPVNGFNIINIGNFVTNLLIPKFKYDDSLYNSGAYYFDQLGLYTSVLCLITLPTTFSLCKRKKEKISFFVILFLVLVSLSSPEIGKIFHFTYSLRYTFLISLTMLITSIVTIAKTKKWGIKNIAIGVGIVLFLYIMATEVIFGRIYSYKIQDLRINDFVEYKHLNMALILSVLYGIVLRLINSKRINKKYVTLLLLVLTLGELKYQGFNAIKSQREEENFVLSFEDSDLVELKETYELLKKFDNSFYRVYSNVVDSNEALSLQMMNVSTYDSTLQSTQAEFLDYMRKYPEVSWDVKFDNPSAYEMLNVKYGIFYKDTVTHTNDLWYCEEIDIGHNKDLFRVYRYYGDNCIAMSYNSIGDKDVVYKMSKDYDNYYVHDIDYYLNENLVLDKEFKNLFQNYIVDQELYERVKYDPIYYNNSKIEFDMELSTKTMMYFSIPYDEGWKVIDGNKELTIYKANGGFIAIPLEIGSHHIQFEHKIEGFNIGLLITITNAILFIYLILKDRFKQGY